LGEDDSRKKSEAKNFVTLSLQIKRWKFRWCIIKFLALQNNQKLGGATPNFD
jgi:hypothetical protein